ncbi:MAG: UvrD-helicase domain-containing protein [Patescibacteria group bacterium]
MLRDLNEKQREAVRRTEGPVLIIAGPGSGKTKTLTHRIVYLIREKGVLPENILAVTFTNKAASEMRSRVSGLLAGGAVGSQASAGFNAPFSTYFKNPALPLVGTFHSLCVRILREDAESLGLKRDFVIYDSNDQLAIVKGAMRELNLNTEQMNPRSVHGAISDAKNSLKTAEQMTNSADSFFAENAAKVYAVYQKRLAECGALDFDDLIMQTTLLFTQSPAVLEKYQDRFHFVMVDEYQDTNHAQYKLVDLLAKKHRNLCVVGDDWQSIYKWRGADIQNILDFEKNYPEAKTVLLEQNYRSTQNILDAAYGVIAKNRNRKEKKLWTKQKGGEKVVVYEAANEKGEAEFIIGEIAKLNRGMNGNAKVNLNDVAILYRTNAQSRSIEESFLEFQVPYKIVGGTKFYDRREVKDVLAYLRFVQNPSDTASLERIINIPARKIGKATLEKVLKEMRKGQTDFVQTILGYQGGELTKDKLAKLKGFAGLILEMKQRMTEEDTGKFLEYLLEKIDYEGYIKDGTEEGEGRWENVRELFTAIEKYKDMPAEEGMRAFSEDVTLISDVDGWEETSEAVTLMTLHAAKGLEFTAVFMVGMEEGLLPHGRTFSDESEMEEERRLCYVGMTRAKRYLFLTCARTRRIFGSVQSNIESRFIGDIPLQLIERQTQGYSYLDDFYEEKYLHY